MEGWTNAVPSAAGLPSFTYTGDYEVIDDGDKNWRIKFLTSGTLAFRALKGAKNGVDIFAVGGGGSGGWSAGSGGGGGYAKTVRKIKFSPGVPYGVLVGAGGKVPTRGAGESPPGGNGGASWVYDRSYTSFILAGGGKGGIGYVEQGKSDGACNGGSGGGGGCAGSGTAKAGGSDGSDGGNFSGRYGKGQRTLTGPSGETGTTREFGEADGDLYAGGGGGGTTSTGTHGAGGAGGGGSGASIGHFAEPGQDNTGGGGGGGGSTTVSSGTYAYPAAGGSGIVIMRNAR